MTLRFGTDGVRGVANAELTPELVVALGRAAARVLGGGRFLVGRDTRVSGTLLQAALSAGLAAEGADVDDLGVLPTPGVAWLAAADGVPAAVISASHNPYPDNGIKFFAAGGRKLSDEVEARLEAELDRMLDRPAPGPTGAGVGRMAPSAGGHRYADAMVELLPEAGLSGLRLVVDCANGAASHVAPDVLRRLGASVQVIGDRPDGVNINAGCGSTAPEPLQREVVAHGADCGLAFDGDADRVLAVDHQGELVDGDQLIAVCALDRHRRGTLVDDTVVITVMSNLGLRQAMAGHGIRLVETDVGDRYVLEALERGGWVLGGEQSGHIVFRDLATTGDGLLTGLQVLDVMARTGRPLAELAQVMTRRPQVLTNVPITRRQPVQEHDDVRAAVLEVEAALAGQGRVLIRPSGTEPVVRVMVEAPSRAEAQSAADSLAGAIGRALGR
ncbi:MAG: phosphoglucosamine mutase [Actinomycetota bacterium]|nr:phosphoglucosamine mutase [Actinomycetota bacterium]